MTSSCDLEIASSTFDRIVVKVIAKKIHKFINCVLEIDELKMLFKILFKKKRASRCAQNNECQKEKDIMSLPCKK